MKYVLDASVSYKWAVPELHSDKANRLRQDVRNLVHEIIAPDFYPTELAHALTRAERKKITPHEASLLQDSLNHLAANIGQAEIPSAVTIG